MYGWGKGRNHVLLVGSVLRVLHDANQLAGGLVAYTELQNVAVSQAVLESLQAEWLAWQKVKQGLSQWGASEALPQSLCQLPFLMTAECKKLVLQGEGSALMHAEVQNSFQLAIHMMRQGAVRPAAAAGRCLAGPPGLHRDPAVGIAPTDVCAVWRRVTHTVHVLSEAAPLCWLAPTTRHQLSAQPSLCRAAVPMYSNGSAVCDHSPGSSLRCPSRPRSCGALPCVPPATLVM